MPVKKPCEDRYKKVFEASPLAIVILDKNRKLLDVNDRLFDWLGYSREEVFNKPLTSLPFLPQHSKLKVIQNFTKRVLGKKVAPYELEFISKEGELKVGLVTGAIIKDDKGRMIEDLVMVDDITDRKHIQESLDSKIKELNDMNKKIIDRELKVTKLRNKIGEMESR